MGIPEMNIISDFEAGMNCLQNPSLISRSFSFPGTGNLSQVYGFWTWGALILAMVAIINKIKMVFVSRLSRIKALASPDSILQSFIADDDFSDYTDDDDDDDTCSLHPSEDGDDDDGYSSTSSFEDRDFSVAGTESSGLRRRRTGESFSWSDFAAGKSVVKLWDSLGLGFDVDSSPERVFSLWDLNSDLKINSIFGQIPAMSTSSPAVVLSGGRRKNGNVVVGAFDARIGDRKPAIYAEWRPAPEGGFSGEVEKVYVMDDVTGGLTVGDMRNMKTPLKSLRKSEVETWWDADAGAGAGEFVEESRKM